MLFKDEVKNYLFRRGVNAVTLLRSLEAKGICVQYEEYRKILLHDKL